MCQFVVAAVELVAGVSAGMMRSAGRAMASFCQVETLNQAETLERSNG